MDGTVVRHISTCMIHHFRSIGEMERQCHLNPSGLRYLSINYNQKGLLYLKPSHHEEGGGEQEQERREIQQPPFITLLKRSLAATLDYFYPLCGRLVTTEHPGEGTASIFIHCNEGAEFIHAAAAGVTVSDLLATPFTPRIVRSFFPLNGAVNHDGHSLPLLAVQVTEIQDGYFIGCAMNHCAVDGASFWHFLNSWSAVTRGGGDALGGIPLPPVVDRWFPETIRPPPLRLPLLGKPDEFIKRPVLCPELEETIFHIPQHAIVALKAKANAEVGDSGMTISSLQALLAYVWQVATRARNIPPEKTTVYSIVIGLRQRLEPPPPLGYLGNLLKVVPVAVAAGELLGLTLGHVAMLLNRAISSQNDAVVRRWAESWAEAPSILHIDGGLRPGLLFTGSSPRFDVRGNDFSLGRPVAVRTGIGNKLDGMLNAHPGPTKGSMQLEMCFPREVLLALMADDEFMSVATVGSTHLQVAERAEAHGDAAA